MIIKGKEDESSNIESLPEDPLCVTPKDYGSIVETTITAKQQDEALRRAWISNTEIKLLIVALLKLKSRNLIGYKLLNIFR